MIVLVATPAVAVAVAATADRARRRRSGVKVTPCELSVVTVLPLASSIVAVITRVAPEVRFVVALVTTTWWPRRGRR